MFISQAASYFYYTFSLIMRVEGSFSLFMSKYSAGDTNFTTQVKLLLKKIYGRSSSHESVLERAIAYYDERERVRQQFDKIHSKLAKANAEKTATTKIAMDRLENEQRGFDHNLTLSRQARYQHLHSICLDILELTEGDSYEDTLRNSARLLGTIQLLSPTDGRRTAIVNEQHKPLYKAVLSLRLLDSICINKKTANSYIDNILDGYTGERYKNLSRENDAVYSRFLSDVKVPLIMANILQDIGNYHPDAQHIMRGEHNDQSPFRTLEIAERKSLLQINYRETIKYLVDGIGMGNYIGNSRVERERFNKNEHNKFLFTKHLLKSSVQPKLGMGNLLKVPQIYASIVLSTKENYNYKLLPKVYQALYQNAERGFVSKDIVDALRKLTGDFPQGYGITFIPNEMDGNVRYEYAIVNQLCPDNPEEPYCRTATRNLTFMGHGQDIHLKKTNNLYFVETAKKFSNLNKERLNEILELLSSNYAERKKLDLLPRCWQPEEFFSIKIHQKLWDRHR